MFVFSRLLVLYPTELVLSGLCSCIMPFWVFKFGPSKIYYSNKKAKIPIHIGDQTKIIAVSVVKANVPMLLGKDILKDLEAKMDFGKESITIDKIEYNLITRPRV